MKEIRWHARAGQGAKTAAQLLANALLRGGKSVQAFPEYGPERRGAPMRAFTRYDDRPIRRHDAITTPDAVVVLEPSLAADGEVTDGLRPGGLALLNAEHAPDGDWSARVLCVPADRIAAEAGSKFVNLVMVAALAKALGEPSVTDLRAAAVELLGAKAGAESVEQALLEGYAWAS
jgi:2-oxoacid:acceptor oxidoreductase gamma subunit (pyruvate/2-ketoisovalerate family)